MWFVHDDPKNYAIEPGTAAAAVSTADMFRPLRGTTLATALYLLHPHAAGLHTVSCGALAHLVCCCYCAVPVPVQALVLFIGTLSPAVVTWGCYNDNEALPQGVWSLRILE